jgi:hypothetical protein|tara:strand:+ start:24114 stop:24548 length:435 start_codon:yes stop_codon:yes gene_type:complete
MTDGIFLTNSAVNSGTAVSLNSNSFTYAWGNIIKKDPVPGKYDIVEVDFAGWENPVIKIGGVIEEGAGSNEITEILLKQFARAYTTQTYLTVVYGNSSTSFTGSDGSTTTIPIIIEDFKINMNATTEKGSVLDYDITLTESKEE